MGAQLACDVPFSAIRWLTLEPIRRRLLGLVGEESDVASILAANFSVGFVIGSLAGGFTCPLDVAKTRRQIKNNSFFLESYNCWLYRTVIIWGGCQHHRSPSHGKVA